eukprot:Skav219520  [mRNA]  locus=scaffold30:151922:156355:+ [translate_table: standard]
MHCRRSNRKQVECGRKLGLNFLVLVLDWLAMGSTISCGYSLAAGVKLTRCQWEAVRKMSPLVDSWNAHDLVDAESMGRTAAKVESIESLLLLLEEEATPLASELRSYMHQHSSGVQNSQGHFGHPGTVIGSLTSVLENVAKDLEPDRLHFHGVPSFDPVPFLDDRNREQYERPLDHACTFEEAASKVPSVRVRIPHRAQVSLLDKLDEHARLALLPFSAVREGLACGMFAIPKDQQRDRLIIDARPANACEQSEDRWVYSLGSVHQLLHIFLQSNQRLVMHCEDLRDFYHSFIIGEQRRQRNGLKLCFRPSQVAHLKCFQPWMHDEEWLVPSLDTMAMGDTNSVAFGQVSHLSLLLRTREFDLEDFLGLRLRPSRKTWHAGLMIDDFVLLQGVEDSELDAGAATLGQHKVAQVRKAYEEAGLPRHEGKSVSSSLTAEFWGVEVDGKRGRVRPNLKRLIPLVHVMLRTIRMGVATVSLLEVLSGSLVSAFQIRRRFMSSLQEIYAAQRGRARSSIVKMSSALIDELFVCLGLLVLTEIDLRLEPAPWLVASDASVSSTASVFTDVGSGLTAEIQRFALQKGLWNRLMSPASAYLREKGFHEHEGTIHELPDRGYDMHPLWEELVSSQSFNLLQFKHVGRKRRHINLLEISASLDAEKKMGAKWPDRYYMHLQDSQVSLACLVKGRSSSSEVNKLLKQSIPDHVTSGIRPFYGYVRSKLNPADDPTRNVGIRSPSRNEAEWLAEAKLGKFEKLDQFLAERQLSILDMAGLPDVSELWPDVDVSAETSKESKRTRGRLRRAMRSEAQTPSDATEAEVVSFSSVPSSSSSVRVIAETSDDTGTNGPERGSQLAAVKISGEGKACAFPDWGSVVQKLLSFPSNQFVFHSSFASLEEALASGPGILDLFSGARGFSRAFVSVAASWSLCFDISHHPGEDLLEPRLQLDLRSLLRAGAFRAMAASPVCASFSTAITPAWRTLEFPEGRPDLTPLQKTKVQLGQSQLAFVLGLVNICLGLGILFWIENPDSSWFWRQHRLLSWDRILCSGEVGDWRVDQCRFGTPWRKRTRFRTNSSLRHSKLLCQCSRPHVILRGRCKERKLNFTKLAESYPRKLCKLLACVFAQDLGMLPFRRRLQLGQCAKCSAGRIGEAKNPGPRRPRTQPQRRTGRLEDVELLEPQTIAMRAKFWNSFSAWLLEEVGAAVRDSITSNPLLMVKALEHYGGLEFSAGTPLYYYRQLLAHVQREFPLTKPFMAVAWRVVSRWEQLEPVQHRPPVPEPLVLAMSSLALIWNWPLFAAATLACFYGICRIGEVLSAERGSLLTPTDLLAEEQVIYLKISKPKSRRRGPSIQYSTISEASVVNFLSFVWQDFSPQARLYPSSPSNFRRRWNALLKALGVQVWHRLTPGSLRGGGCVAAHRKGLAIQDLLWRMRLQHTKTLCFYLQETTAESILPALTADCRETIQILRSLLPLQMQAFQQRTPSK